MPPRRGGRRPAAPAAAAAVAPAGGMSLAEESAMAALSFERLDPEIGGSNSFRSDEWFLNFDNMCKLKQISERLRVTLAQQFLPADAAKFIQEQLDKPPAAAAVPETDAQRWARIKKAILEFYGSDVGYNTFNRRIKLYHMKMKEESQLQATQGTIQ
jgi:hypothetical protein